MTCLDTRHPSPLGFDIVVPDQADRRFHIIQKEFRIEANRVEQAIVKIKRKGSIIAVFRIITLFHKQRSRRDKEPRFHVVIENLEFANTKRCIANSKFIAMAKKISRVILIRHAHTVIEDSQIRIKAHHAKRADHQIKAQHVVRKRKLVQCQVVIVTRAPVHHVTAKVQAQPVVVESKVRAVTSIARVFDAGIVFLSLDFQEFTIIGFRTRYRFSVAQASSRVPFIVNAGIQHKVDGIDKATQVNTAIKTRPNRISNRFSIHAIILSR